VEISRPIELFPFSIEIGTIRGRRKKLHGGETQLKSLSKFSWKEKRLRVAKAKQSKRCKESFRKKNF
jgi:hypothetical protein